ncbi:CCA tRNA nucleotidyltransferase [Falsibacillus pallidus]|uniref:CCA tRNA nucleotidyltransferase n=1 Tax=Falsibacillus pallidus TaxID=493781 RepID=UPI003D995471
MIEPFKKALPVLKRIEEAGYEAYFVGGAVRDYLINREIHDIDIATSAFPEEIKVIFKSTVDVGIEHGTVLVIEEGEPYEITTFRSESDYKDYRRPDKVTFIRSLNKDLERRDFTMNAMAMDRTGIIIDPFHGKDAIEKRLIQTVGSADERFTEDALRILRAVRFAGQLGFRLENRTQEALGKHAHLLEHIAIERILAEFEKLLNGKSKKESIQLLTEAEIHHYLPGLSDKGTAINEIAKADINPLTSNQMWLFLLFILEEPAPQEFLKRWKMPLKKIKYLSKSLQILRNRAKREWELLDLYEAGLQSAIDVEIVYRVINKQDPETKMIEEMKLRFESLPIQERGELDVTGNDLMSWRGQAGGPWIKETMQKIEYAVLNGIIKNEKAIIKEWLESWNRR